MATFVRLGSLAAGILSILLIATPSAFADDLGGQSIAVPSTEGRGQESAAPSDSAATTASEESWRYDTYYILPLTRHMSDSGLHIAGQIILYPFGAAIDLIQLPVGLLAGLVGE